MQIVDPWEGYNEGTKTLAGAARTSEELRRNKLEEARQAELDARRRTEWEQKQADDASLRSALREASAPKLTDVPDKERQSANLNAYVTAQYPPQGIEGIGGMGVNGQGEYGTNNSDAFIKQRQAENAPLYKPAGQYETERTADAQTLAAATPAMKQEMVTPTPWQAQINAAQNLMRIGHPEGEKMYKTAVSGLFDEAGKRMLIGGGQEAVNLVNQALGTDMKFVGDDKDVMIVQGKNGTFMVDKNAYLDYRKQGLVPELAFQKAAHQVDEKAQRGFTKTVDLGDRVQFYDDYGKLIREEKKAAKPDTLIKIQHGTGTSGDEAIPIPVVKELQPKYDLYKQGDDLVNTFDPSFTVKAGLLKAAPKTISEGITALTKQYGENHPSTQFWMDYQRWVNKTRKDLFGTALTKTELPQFEKVVVNPGMNPETIQANLARQRELAANAYEMIRSGQTPSRKFGKTVEKVYPSVKSEGPKIPQGAIDALKAGKGTDAQFDAIFGAGAAKRARGGK